MSVVFISTFIASLNEQHLTEFETEGCAQADGSAMYSLQALWTQAREQLHVITIICANRSYAILRVSTAQHRHAFNAP